MTDAHRDLDSAELQAVVDDLAAHRERWERLVRHEDGRRVCELLRRDDHVEVWLICWDDGNDTGVHDHDLSAGAVAVLRGAVRGERLVLAGSPAGRTVGPVGASRSAPPPSTASSTPATSPPSPSTGTTLPRRVSGR